MTRLASLHRLAVVTLLGFASGLPLALTGQAMQAWLTVEGLDLAAIGFLSLVGLPYTFKFLWAPLMDRFDLPLLGRRRGWLVVTQLLMAAVLLALSSTSPKDAIRAFALLAVCVAFVSATQDIIIDAYRTDLLPAAERGLGASLNVMGYRLAMILSGGIALIWTDPGQAGGPGGGWTWPEVYRFMALLMGGSAVLSLVVLPALPEVPAVPVVTALPSTPSYEASANIAVTTNGTPSSPSPAANDLRGFAAVLAAVVLGAWLSDRFGPPLMQALLGPLLQGGSLPPPLQKRWLDLAALLAGIAFTLPLAAWAAKLARFDTLLGGLKNYFSQRGAAAFLVFIVLYKLGDAFAVSLMTPFLLTAMAYTSAEVGVVNKVLGLWMTIGGALLGGLLMVKLGLWRALMFFGVLQLLSNLGFWWLAVNGKGVLPGTTLPAFDWGFVKLATPTPVDGGLLLVVAFDNIAGGMGTAAFLAFLMSLCNRRFTATQFALLSAFASVGRVWVGPLAGVLAQTIGWPTFFIISTVLAVPALVMLWVMRGAVRGLEGG